MTEKTSEPPIMKPAPRGSKAGWRTVTTQVPGDLYDQLVALQWRRQQRLTDLGHEALRRFVQAERRRAA